MEEASFCERLYFETEEEVAVFNDEILHLQRFEKGIKSDNELLRVKNIRVIKKTQRKSLYAVVVTEGKKRHLRRLFKALGFLVTDLKRVRIGRLTLGGLRPGGYKVMSLKAIYSLFRI